MWIIYESYMDLIWIPIRILYGSLYGSYRDPYMNPIQIQAARVQKCITVVRFMHRGYKVYNCRQIQAARMQRCLTVVRFMYQYTTNGHFASGLLQFIVSVGDQQSVITTQNSRERSRDCHKW